MGKIIFTEDLRSVCEAAFIPWEDLKNSTVFITGATGLIGTGLVNSLSYVSAERNLGIKLIALVRDECRAKQKFHAILDKGMLSFVQGSVEQLPEIPERIDYIIHGASQTASGEFVNHAVETINTAIAGTKNLLELAKEKKIKGFVYMSSMEVYGSPVKGHHVSENETGVFTPLNLRNSYPISKIMCEIMCCAYAQEYNVPAKIVRLTQTFGPGGQSTDNRIFAYIGKCAKNKQNIILKTAGDTERCYLYTADAVTAILTILLKGEKGAIYNAANEDTYCSIREMAEMVAKNNSIEVKYDIQPPSANGYPETMYMYLDITKLKQLGWKPVTKLEDAFFRLIESMK